MTGRLAALLPAALLPAALLTALLLTACAAAPVPSGGGKSPDRGPVPADGRAGANALSRNATPRSLPPVVSRIPTRDRVVFLTYDDGAERDPAFIDLVRERRLPVTMFLTDSVVGPGYAHFARLRAVGASIQNHTLDHPALRGLPYAGQRAEICGQQNKLGSRFGIRPHLFRPPYGIYDTTTRRAAATCGIRALILWRASLTETADLTFTRGTPRLRPGDIVSIPSTDTPALSLHARTTHILKLIGEQDLRVGRLEDYIGLNPARPALEAEGRKRGPGGGSPQGRPGQHRAPSKVTPAAKSPRRAAQHWHSA